MIAPRIPERPSAVCPSRSMFRLIGDRWTLLALLQLEQGVRRFADIRRGLGTISAKVLAEKLRRLEENGIVRRRVYDQSPPRVEYRLTALGQELAQHVSKLDQWTLQNAERIERSRRTFSRSQRSRTPWQIPRPWE